jgi:NTE family protein
MQVVRLLAPRLDHEDQTKDVDFSPHGIERRWRAGYETARQAITSQPWERSIDPLEGVILHEFGTSRTAVPTEINANVPRRVAV